MNEPVSLNSPCINICTINPENGYCFGCYRTIREIADWCKLSDEEKLRLAADLSDRRDASE